MTNLSKAIILGTFTSFLTCQIALAQTPSPERAEIGGVYTILEGTKLEYVSVGSDDNVLRCAKSNRPLEQKWDLTYFDHPTKGRYYQFQSPKNGLFLTSSILPFRPLKSATSNAAVTHEANLDAQTFTITPVPDDELNKYAPGLFSKILISRSMEKIGQSRKHTAVRIARYGYDDITDKASLGVLSNGNIAAGGEHGTFDAKDYSNHKSRFFILVEDDTPNPHSPYNLQSPRPPSHSAARGIEIRAGHTARAISRKNYDNNKAIRAKNAETFRDNTKKGFDDAGRAIGNEFTKAARALNLTTDFKLTANAALSGYNNKALSNVTVAQCKIICAEETSFICKSFDYHKNDSKCDLSDKNAKDVGGLKTNYTGSPFDHYEYLTPNNFTVDPETSLREVVVSE